MGGYAEAMYLSRRTGWESGENEWAQRLRAAQASGRELVDLTVSNPTECGLAPGGTELLAPLAEAGALRYAPDPLGMRSAREAVAEYYRDHGAAVPVERLCLTTSTSEAYSFLFRLLCDAGDEVLIARPSYPLFDLLARLDDVVLREYPLFYDPGARRAGWSIDVQAIEAAITERTRAVIVVHPNNPTGHFVSAAERRALRALCVERGLALIADEVFLDYPIADSGAESSEFESFAAEASECVCFVLSGLSKVCALPQMKLSWIAALGPERQVAQAMERMEVVADTFLSVSTPTQFALPRWLAARVGTQERIRERLRANLIVLDERLKGSLADRLTVEGGWTAVLRVPSTVDGEEFALAAMRRGVVVQPGAFYGFPPGRCVVSLLTRPEVWARGLALLPV